MVMNENDSSSIDKTTLIERSSKDTASRPKVTCLVFKLEEIIQRRIGSAAQLLFEILEEEVVGNSGVDEFGVPLRHPGQLKALFMGIPASEKCLLNSVCPGQFCVPLYAQHVQHLPVGGGKQSLTRPGMKFGLHCILTETENGPASFSDQKAGPAR